MNRTICQRHTRAGSGRRQRESKGQRSRDGATVTPAWRCNGVGSSHRGRSEAFVQTGWQGRGLGGSLPFQLGFTLYLQATSSQWPTCLRKGQPRPSPPVSATLPCLPRRGKTPSPRKPTCRGAGWRADNWRDYSRRLFKRARRAHLWHVYFLTPALRVAETAPGTVKTARQPATHCVTLETSRNLPEPCFALSVDSSLQQTNTCQVLGWEGREDSRSVLDASWSEAPGCTSGAAGPHSRAPAKRKGGVLGILESSATPRIPFLLAQ